jgi:hypothetical protein
MEFFYRLEKVSTGAVVATSTGPVLLAATTDGEILAWSLPLLEAITSIDGLSNIREALASQYVFAGRFCCLTVF